MAQQMFRYAAIYEAPLLEVSEIGIAAPPVKIEVVTGPRQFYRVSNHQGVIPVVNGEECPVLVTTPEVVALQRDKRYIIISTLTRDNPFVVEHECRRIVERMVALVGLILSPTLFAVPVFTGWASEIQPEVVHAQVLYANQIHIEKTSLTKTLARARESLSRDGDFRNKFDLMAALFHQSIGAPPSEASYLWAWMCLEVYPMLGTQKYGLILPCLADITSIRADGLRGRIDIGELYRIRCKLVHSGGTGLTSEELSKKLTLLRAIVYTVMRSMCGLPYDGEIDRVIDLAPNSR